MKTFSRWSLIALVVLVVACSQLVRTLDGGYEEKVAPKTGSTSASLVFSHNINGETQPCGCRQFPLGGLEQVAGIFHQLSERTSFIYVDTGDAFFPSPIIPDPVRKSWLYNAQGIHHAFETFKLTFFVPGDQDFAAGLSFLENLSQKASYTFLLSNLKSGTKIKSRPWAKVDLAGKTLYFIGILYPELLPPEVATYFSSPEEGIKNALNSIGKLAETDQVILLSHSGMDKDKELVNLYPRLNWVLGAHSQSYTIRPTDQGTTQLVQVLSRNHFLGEIKFPLNDTEATSFGLLESREELAQVVNPNPMTSWMQNYRQELKKIQIAEDSAQTYTSGVAEKLPTANSCLDCHQKQVSFWQTTSHSLNYQTLIQKGSQYDPQCIGCHSAGYKHPQGFSSIENMVVFKEEPKNKEAHLKQYWEELSPSFAKVKSIRQMDGKTRQSLSVKWMKQDEKFGVTHNYANVQCINCHDKTREHPFDGDKKVAKMTTADYQNKCLECHTKDQSPQWYIKDEKGLPGAVDAKIFSAQLKRVSCPK